MPAKPDRLLLFLAYLGFVSLGLPDAVLGIAWPSLRETFGLSQSGLGWILSAGASGYFLSGLFAGRVLNAVGVGVLLFGSTALVALGVGGYASAPSVVVFSVAAMVVGWGSGAVDTGLNVYAAVHFRAGHMAWLHAAYSAGAALGSMTMAVVVAERVGWRYGYALVGALLTLLTVAFLLTRRRWSNGSNPSAPTSKPPASVSARAALQLGRVQLGMLLFFVYAGVEFGTGHWAFTVLREGRGLSRESAGFAVSSFWTCLLLGRVTSGFVVDRIGLFRMVRLSGGVAVTGALLFATPGLPPLAYTLALALIGAGLAPIYPTLMSATPARVGNAASHAVGFQVSSATAGMVALPALGGLLADHVGLHATAALVFTCALLVVAIHELLERSSRAHAP